MKFILDLLPLLLFFIAYKAYDIFVATAVAIIATAGVVGYLWWSQRRVEKLHLITLGMLLLFGGLTLLLRDPSFIQWRPTVVSWLFATALLLAPLFSGGKTLLERMMGHVIPLPAAVWVRLNGIWIGFFLLMGGLNLWVATSFEEATWVHFKLFGQTSLTVLFVIAQGFYLVHQQRKYAMVTAEESVQKRAENGRGAQ